MLDWGWLTSHVGAFADRTVQHVYLAAIGLLVGFLIAFALALWAVRRRRAYPPIAGLAGVVYTIPSLVLFAALVPITGISLLTAEVPLVLYTQVIFIRNIVAGFDAVPADVVEAAAGMGYTPNQRLWRVELPLAVPLIVAGLRVASVSTIGLVTITGTLGDRFGGLGFFIFEGYSRSFSTEILAGAVLSIALALAVDFLLVRAQRWLTPWTRPPAPADRLAAVETGA
ncbi:MAG TPA: ABC transporter permease [Candidatus Baltobacteraceae bacterium]|nr:ABC transporter permease [Candidatus Baltobacteraceae bacterium]